MSVGWTCPSRRDEDPELIEMGVKKDDCPGHKKLCRVQGTPKSVETAIRELARLNNKEN